MIENSAYHYTLLSRHILGRGSGLVNDPAFLCERMLQLQDALEGMLLTG
jgi:hypothetical protein